MSFLRSLYHALFSPSIRSRLGIGRWIKQMSDRRQQENEHDHEHELVASLLCHSPFSAGDIKQRSTLTLAAAGSCYTTLLQFLKACDPGFFDEYPVHLSPTGSDKEQLLKRLFDQHRSDKAIAHDYHLLYALLIVDRSAIHQLLEIGIGSNNPLVVSNMGETGSPGASLRAWRDFLPNATIQGADIDESILFSEERIHCHHVDQLSPSSLQSLRNRLIEPFDVIIDDGLHSIQANLQTLQMALQLIKPDGWIFIEDIFEPQADFFLALGWILHQQGIASRLYSFDQPGMIFVVSVSARLNAFPG